MGKELGGVRTVRNTTDCIIVASQTYQLIMSDQVTTRKEQIYSRYAKA